MDRALGFVLVLFCVMLSGCAEGTPKPPVAGSPESRSSGLPGLTRSAFEAHGINVSVHLPKEVVTPLPAVLVLHSAMGRTESVLAYADSLAEHGFAVYALDFFNGKTAKDPSEGRMLRDDANARAMVLQAAIRDAYDLLASDVRIQAKQRFLLGWSYGAAWATHMAGKLSNVAGVVAFYGEAFSDNAALYDQISAPVLLIGGTRDESPSSAILEQVENGLRTKGTDASLLLVDAGHGFAERRHPGFNQKAADEGWAEAVRFLERHSVEVLR